VPSLDIAACAALMDNLTRLAARAADKIEGFSVKAGLRSKEDGSPVTAADEAADALICDSVKLIAPQVPIISEEQAARTKPQAIKAGSYFLVDPLDGTREFIAGSEEYTVNIALLTDGSPVLGIICAPAMGLLWRGIVGHGADWMRLTDVGKFRASPIHTRPRREAELVVLLSRSHLDGRTKAYVAAHPHAKRIQCGSSVKFCRVAEGAADLYPRLGPTRDWDVAAGHAIVAAAGGKVVAPDGSALVYGSADLVIPAFIASGS
jgi:3'(2'), 5'-bisphosphate nucleotidase